MMGEEMFNGVVLPEPWPPRYGAVGREPMPVPYLTHVPDIIPIDVGRQLFVDDFLVEETSLEREMHLAQFHPASPVLVGGHALGEARCFDAGCAVQRRGLV